MEDVVFAPGSADELASVGDDQAVLLWDRRCESDIICTLHTLGSDPCDTHIANSLLL